MDPMIIALSTSLVNAAPEIIKKYSELFARQEKAKSIYFSNEFSESLESKQELYRRNLIGELTKAQNEIQLSVSDASFLIKVIPLSVDLMTQMYEAKSEQQLKTTEMSLSQIKVYLEQYKKIMRNRSYARWAAVLVTVLALLILVLVILHEINASRSTFTSTIPVLDLPLPILVWSAIGSFTAILYRFNNSGDIELQDPLRWLFTRPLTGVVMGAITYFVIKLGFLTVGMEDSANLDTSKLLWVIAFLGGFSDKFADSLLKSLVGKFGGDSKENLVNMEYYEGNAKSALSKLLEALPIFNQNRNMSITTNDPSKDSSNVMEAISLSQEEDADQRTG
jgi:uncharacterized integral membrane protein